MMACLFIIRSFRVLIVGSQSKSGSIGMRKSSDTNGVVRGRRGWGVGRHRGGAADA